MVIKEIFHTDPHLTDGLRMEFTAC